MSAAVLRDAWVLHCRPYKETSVIAELLTLDAGKMSVVASGVRCLSRRKKSSLLLQPFSRLLVSWRGNGELKTLMKSEIHYTILLSGKYLFCGLYINELLVRLLQPCIPMEGVCTLYEILLKQLEAGVSPEPCLRLFEKSLLSYLGYALPLSNDSDSQKPINPELNYAYDPEQGFTAVKLADNCVGFPGWVLLSYAENIITSASLPWLKRLNRIALQSLLGNKPLKSRSLFANRPLHDT